MDSSTKYFNPSPEKKASFPSKLFFCWILPFFKYGYQNDLQIKDIYNTTDADSSGHLGDALERNWLAEIERALKNKHTPSLKRAIFKTFAKSYSIYGIYLFLQSIIFKSLQPEVLARYIRYFKHSESNAGPLEGWLLGIGVILVSFINTIIFHHCFIGCQRIGMRVRIACSSLVYRKLLKLNQSSLRKTAAGQMVNLLSNDADRFEIASNFLHYIWIMPLQVMAALYLMFNSVGYAMLTGMIVVTLEAIPLQGYLSKLQGKLRYRIAVRTDFRVKLMNEIISGIQVIKMYAWEKPFEKMVEVARKLEIHHITKTSYIKGISAALAVITERLILYLTVITYALLGNKIEGDVVFSVAQLFNSVQLYMTILFPNALSSYAEAKVTIRRLQEFLLLEENETVLQTDADVSEEENIGSVKLSAVNASWTMKSEIDTLRDINLNVIPGQLCCVVGSVGAGKSSLLQVLLKEMYLKSGEVEVNGVVSYASQEPWLFVSNIRDNILFGRPYIKNRYKTVIRVCALEKDLQQFPLGDKTLVGERGVSLSGGQKARINLARAVYAKADIYLLDDPLSAVDTHVAKHLFEECIMKYLGNKSRILVTHQHQFLIKADAVILIESGKLEKAGTFSELSDEVLSKLDQGNDEKDKENKEDLDKRERIQSISSIGSTLSSIGKEEEDTQENEELIEKGAIPMSIYKEYWQAGASIWNLVLLLLILVLGQMSCNGCEMWVTHWISAEEVRNISNSADATVAENPGSIDTQSARIGTKIFYVTVYTLLMMAAIFLTCFRSILFYKFCMNASKKLHNNMFSCILKAPMRFFDMTPSGRILNRFSKDIGAIDEILPASMMGVTQIFLLMFGIVAMVLFVTPWMMIPTIVLAYLFYQFRRVYMKTAQSVRRLEAVNRAPLFTYISASFYGLPTIRSSKAQGMVAEEFDILQDRHTGAWYLFLVCSESFGFFLDVISTLFLTLVTLQFMFFNKDTNISGYVGLVISSSLILTGMLQFGIRQTADVASNMTSVERVLQYTKLQREGNKIIALKHPDKEWPHSGKILFKNAYLRYGPDEPPALRNLNITIEPGEKIGIVGRTGSGKSTLIASLFRLAVVEGVIAIDDVDTSTVSLNILRSKISIIPQDPVLFSATVRYNLDPFDTVDDEVLWKALADVELKSSIDSLDQAVSEGGSNFSAGQRQLICLARAIIRDNKILVMDEATANVDPHTDLLIQKTIRENFENCTVLTVAHRLNTIMDSDKVLVLEHGEAMEFAHPHLLLQNPKGYFTKMVKETGDAMESTLCKIALDDFESKFPDAIKDIIESAMQEDE